MKNQARLNSLKSKKMLIFSLGILLLEVTVTIAKTPTEQFNEAMKIANSLQNTIRSDGKVIQVTKSTGETVTFDPQTVFKDQPGGYTNNPPQVDYGTNASAMENIAQKGIIQGISNAHDHSAPAVGKMVADNFKTRPVFKISKDDDFIVKSNAVIRDAQNIGQPNNGIDCNLQPSTQEKCIATFEQKTCNEEIRSVTKVCEQIPKVTIINKDVVNTNCKHLEIRYGHYNGCRAGYRQLLYTDVIKGPNWDDVFLCDRPAWEGEQECYLGYAVYGCHHKSNRRNDYENIWAQGIIPKKLQGYIRIERIYGGGLSGMIINVTTGEVVSKGSFSENQVIQLPVSETQDQVFKYEPQAGKGVVVIYVERINRVKEAKIQWEESCREI